MPLDCRLGGELGVLMTPSYPRSIATIAAAPLLAGRNMGVEPMANRQKFNSQDAVGRGCRLS
jgi:hypothetical protein